MNGTRFASQLVVAEPKNTRSGNKQNTVKARSPLASECELNKPQASVSPGHVQHIRLARVEAGQTTIRKRNTRKKERTKFHPTATVHPEQQFILHTLTLFYLEEHPEAEDGVGPL